MATNGTVTRALVGKIGARKYMMDLFDDGTVFMQRWEAFVAYEDDVRGDRNEGLDLRYTSLNPTLEVHAELDGKKVKLAISELKVKSEQRHHGVYCMSTFPPLDGTQLNDALLADSLPEVLADRRFLEFGDTLVLMNRSDVFIHRLAAAASVAGMKLMGGPVEYVSEAHCGSLGPFRKLDSYAYQRECRFVTNVPLDGPSLMLKLGSLHDIAQVIDLRSPEVMEAVGWLTSPTTPPASPAPATKSEPS